MKKNEAQKSHAIVPLSVLCRPALHKTFHQTEKERHKKKEKKLSVKGCKGEFKNPLFCIDIKNLPNP